MDLPRGGDSHGGSVDHAAGPDLWNSGDLFGDCSHDIPVRQAEEYRVRIARHRPVAFCERGAGRGALTGTRGVVHHQPPSGTGEVRGHRSAHVAEPDETESQLRAGTRGTLNVLS